MRKLFTISMLSLFAAAGLNAAGITNQSECGKIDVKDIAVSHVKDVKAMTNVHGAPAQAPDIITNPQGETHWYWMNGSGTYPDDGTIKKYNMTDGAARLIFGEDNKVYIRDFFEVEEGMDLGRVTYLEGEIEGNEIVIPLPQTLFELAEGTGIYVSAQAYEITDEGYMPDNKVAEVRFSYDKYSDEVSFDGLGDNRGLGMFYTGSSEFTGWWTGYSQARKVYTPNDVQMVTVPEGLEPEPYICFLDDDYTIQFNLYRDKDTYYLQGLDANFPHLTVKGEMQPGNIFVIPSRQFVGTARYCFTWSAAQDASTGAVLDDYKMYYDAREDSFNILESDKLMCFGLFVKMGTSGSQVFLAFMSYINFFLLPIHDVDGIPADPYNLKFNDEYIMFDFHSFWFNLPALTTEDEFINENNLYYTVYRNGAPMEFKYDTTNGYYPGVSGTMIEIPYAFNNNFDIAQQYSEHQIGVYDVYGSDPTISMGVQQIYKHGDVITVSKLLTLDVQTGKITAEDHPYESAVNALVSDVVESVEYYDLAGRRVLNPSNGIFIKKMRMADGTISTVKEVIAQ